jgi:DNA replication protein
MKHLLKTLIEEKIIDYNTLVLHYYHHFDITETEAIALMKLNALLEKKRGIIQPDKFALWLSTDKKGTEEILTSLMNKGYLQIKLISCSNGKEKETFDVDYFLTKVVDYVLNSRKTTSKSITHEYVSFLEDTLQKPLSPLDIEIITKWIDEDNYSLEMVKEAALQALKRTNPNIKHIDKILLDNVAKFDPQPKKKEVLTEFFKLWEE